MDKRFRVVVVGGGYAGALAAARLGRNAAMEVTLIAAGGQLVHRVRLYRELSLRPDGRLAFPLQPLVGPRVRVVDAWATSVDVDARRVQTSQGALPYDALLVATGSVGRAVPDELAATDSAPTVVEATHASLAELRRQLPELSARCGRVVIAGGGTTAVELAGTLGHDWPRLRVTMISPQAPLASAGPTASSTVLKRLQRLGVTWQCGRVAESIEQGVRLTEGDTLEADVLVWATGMESRAASVLANALPIPCRGDGRVAVLATLQLPDRPEVFVVGDAAAVQGQSGCLPMGCKVAMPMAAHAADAIVAMRSGRQPEAFAYVDPGSVVAVGGSWALTMSGADEGVPALTVGSRAVGLVKWLLCWYVVASIRLQATGWFWYRWRRRPLAPVREPGLAAAVDDDRRVHQ
jgi:NADH dehydrogenase